MSTNNLIGDSLTSQVMPVSLNLEQATGLITERARKLVKRVIEEKGHDKPPFLPEEFAHLVGIKEIVRTDLGEVSAVLLKLHDGDIIKVNANHHPVRQNFSCAHEIGHALLNQLKLEPCIEDVEFRTFNPQAPAIARAKARERLCDAAATELLMPESVFKKYLTAFGVSIYSVERLANIFRVSIRAAAIRIAEVSIEPCMTLLWQPWLRARSKGLRKAWCIGPGIKSGSKTNYMPLHTYVRCPSMLHKAYQDDSPVKSFKLFKIGDTVKRLPMESKGFGHDETRYVISLAFLDR